MIAYVIIKGDKVFNGGGGTYIRWEEADLMAFPAIIFTEKLLAQELAYAHGGEVRSLEFPYNKEA